MPQRRSFIFVLLAIGLAGCNTFGAAPEFTGDAGASNSATSPDAATDASNDGGTDGGTTDDDSGNNSTTLPELDRLDISGATLVPEFSPGVFEYEATGAAALDLYTILAESSSGVVSIDGVSTTALELRPFEGETNLTIEVSNNSGMRSYLVAFSRPGFDETFLKASSVEAAARFGEAVASHQGHLGVGAPLQDAGGANAGAVHVFERSTDSWAFSTQVESPEPESNDQFGDAVDVFEDILVVGAPFKDGGNNGAQIDSGAVFIFRKVNDQWTFAERVESPTPQAFELFGSSVAIDGNILAVGATATNDRQASPVGAVFVFDLDGEGQATFQTRLQPAGLEADDAFGSAVAMDASRLLVGAIGEDSRATGVVQPNMSLDDSSTDSGAAYLFQYDSEGGVWEFVAIFKPHNVAVQASFGDVVDIRNDLAVVGALQESTGPAALDVPLSGAVYVFRRGMAAWQPEQFLKPRVVEPDDAFGSAVAITSTNQILVGSLGESNINTGLGVDPSDNGASGAGAAYLFSKRGDTWEQDLYLKAPNAEAEDSFGYSATATDFGIVVCANGDDSQSDPALGGANESGACYAFE
jgi:hypothetical protein